MARRIKGIDGIEIKGSENTGGGIPEPTTDGNNVRTKSGSTLSWLQTELVSTTEKSTWNGKQDYLWYTPENTANKGVANGYVPLDSSSKIASTYLPSYVDDILEFANLASFPVTGETGKIYVALDTNLTYRWSGSAYVQVGGGAIPTTIGNRLVINKTASWSITQTEVNNTIAGGYSGITYVYNSTTAGNFTVPALTVPIGFTIRVHVIGTGMVTVVPSSTTINSRDNLLKSVAQHSAFELEYIMTDVYQLAGDLV